LTYEDQGCTHAKPAWLVSSFFASHRDASLPRNTRNPSKQPAANGGDTKGQPQLPLNFALGFLSFKESTKKKT